MKRQSKQSKITIKSVLCVLLIIGGIGTFSSMSVNGTTVSYELPSYSSLIPHAPIEISSDSELEVFPGSGTAEDPYVIEGYNITTSSSSGIYIYGTTKFFIVRNCYVDAENYGILIWDVTYGTATIENNMCINNGYGIYLDYSGSSGSTISNNTCSYNDVYGIYLWYSSGSTISNNTCSYNNNYGIYLWYSSGSTVTDNTCYHNNNYGIYLWYSAGSNVNLNTCYHNKDYSICLAFSGSSTVSDNTCNSDYGIGLFDSGSSTVANNNCNNNHWGIYLDSSDSSIVSDNDCSYNHNFGIYLYNSSSCFLSYNLFQENGEYGIDLHSSSANNLIHNNTFVDNNLGGTSQGHDDGANNYWYDSTIQEGNYWSDWSGTGSYSIDGVAGAFDLYPLDEPTVNLGPPVITTIIHSPSTPKELDPVDIYTTVTSLYGVQSVTLHYRINGGTWIEDSMTLISGDLYSGTIGPFPVDYIIEYYITAIDNSVNHNEVIENNNGQYYNLFVVSSDVIGPIITSIINSPSTPTELDTISISATVTDSSGVQSVTLHYRINGGTWLTISMTLVNGDLYSGTISSFAVSDTIEYYISALDSSISHNLAINDNSGEYYSFTIHSSGDETRTVMFSLLLPVITVLFLGFGLVVLKRRKSV